MTLCTDNSLTSQIQQTNQYQVPLALFPSTSATISPDASSSLLPATQQSSLQARLKPYSCLQCKHRKVKCDRIHPCASCRRAGAECVYRAPPPPKRRKRVYLQRSIEIGSAAGSENHEATSPLVKYPSDREQELLEKVKKYEDLLKDLGVLERLTVGTGDEETVNLALRNLPTLSRGTSARSADSMIGRDGKLIAKYGKSRLLENSLWMSVTGEFQDPEGILEEISEDENGNDGSAECETVAGTKQRQLRTASLDPITMILPVKGIDDAFDLRSLHPQPAQIFMIWQVFVDNVNPLMKILHVPTTQKALVDATSNLDHVSKAIEALLFGICVIAVSSMEEMQCQSILQESKAFALKRFSVGAKQALRRAGILKTSDMIVLQAFVLFLSSARPQYDAHSFWSLTGISVRIGQRIGLHRDGDSLKLSPFETEMRRRLWTIITQLDSRAAELSGSGLSIISQLEDTKPPLNVNDCDLYPDMPKPPTEYDKATEMMFLLLRAQIRGFLKNEMPQNAFDGDWSGLSNPAISLTEKDHAINKLEQILQERFIRHCDVQIPLHCFSSIVAKAAVCKIRLLAHLPRITCDNSSSGSTSTSASPVEEDLLFANSLQILQYDTQIRTTKSLHRFLWHVEKHFQWHALIYLLTYLLTHPSANSRTDATWATIDEVFANNQEIIYGGRTRSKLCIAISGLALKAWEAREIEERRSNHTALLSMPPSCIKELQRQKLVADAALLCITPGQAALVRPVRSVTRAIEDQVRQQEYDAGDLQGEGDDGFGSHFASHDDVSNLSIAIDANGIEMTGIDASAINWEQWDSMCREFEMQDHWGDAFGSVDTFP